MVKEPLNILKDNAGKRQLQNGFTENCPHEAHLLKLDTSQAQLLLDWKPVYGINQTVSKTIRWYK
jgi:CDP-glucose 4,6-dehydratase